MAFICVGEVGKLGRDLTGDGDSAKFNKIRGYSRQFLIDFGAIFQ